MSKKVILMNQIKKYLPNILTVIRIILTPLIVYLGITKQISILFILAIIIAITDFLDGRLARKWQTNSSFGKKLDIFSDRILTIGLLIILMKNNTLFLYVLILETIIILFYMLLFFKTKRVESLLVNKIKTWLVFFTVLLGIVEIFIFKLNIVVNIFLYLTLFLQLITIIKCIKIYKNKQEKKNHYEDKEYIKIVKDILNHKEFLKRKEFEHHYNESVYDHVLRVSYDCYKIGKKLKLDYKALAIAGLLHDFYDKPWQKNFEKKKLFEKHGFVHAEQARKNAKKYFPNLVNEKIEDMIKTHMFPLNIRLPKYKESWLLTFIDKADSMDFLLHPFLLTKVGRKYKQKKK